MSRFVPVLLAAAVLLPAPLAAQAVDVGKLDRRVGTLESEMRAVQRKVFPGGNARFFEPEIPAQAATPAPAPETPPATTPVADLTGRVDALEGQLKTMTGQIEAMEYKLRQLEDGQRRLKGDTDFRLNALENPGSAPPAPAADPAAVPGKLPALSAATPAPAPAKPAVPTAKPATDTAAWTAAYPKVTARDWPGVETAMSQFIADWPKSIRVPQAKYWLGRSFAARTQYPQAAKAFLDVYQSAPRSTPAPDALIALANALNAMIKPKDACQVLGELESVYGAKLTDTQKADAGRQRTKAKCTA
ncbi:YbgF trimerization domain-containing protein [Sandarakinorhabdus limnophila]|uniref:YbgF trimerization domain-containing protein n=1 Tax=Sandarakinorhabdus limnophila TaxID=210512 RepID=UPI002355846C